MQQLRRLIVAVFIVSMGTNAIAFDPNDFYVRPKNTILYKTKFFESTFQHTKALWADDSVSSFRGSFSSSDWDELKNEQFIETDSESTKLRLVFPLSKRIEEETIKYRGWIYCRIGE